MKNSQSDEKEFGVPIAGKILEPEQWAKTALKKLPPQTPLDLLALFGRAAPLIVDLGCGNGRFLIQSAVARPDHDHIGIDVLPVVLRYATRRGNQRGLHNLRLAAIDAQTFVAKYLAEKSVREMHCYHPQPFHHPGDIRRRLIKPRFLAQVHDRLEAGGTFCLQTDNAPYWEYMKSILPRFFEFREQLKPWPDAPQGRTRREIIALRRGYAVFRGWGSPLPLGKEEALEIAATLPAPTFAAGPRLKDIDRLEHEEGA